MRLVWRSLKWTLLALLATVLLVVAINAFDEPLRPEVRAALQPPVETVPPQDNLFYALLGFTSPSADPVQAGIAERRRLERAPPTGKAQDIGAELRRQQSDGMPGALRFQGDPGPLNEAGATLGEMLAALQAGRIDDQAVVAANQVLLARYRSLRRYGQSANYLRSDAQVNAPVPLGAITTARKVWLLSLAGMVARQEIDAAVRELRDDTLFWRAMLAQAQTPLIDKMILTAFVLRDLQSGSELVHLGLAAQQRGVLAEAAGPLTPAERSLAGALLNETRFAATLLARQAQDGLGPFDPSSADEGKPLTPAVRRALDRAAAYFFQPKAVINQHHRAMRKLLELDAHDCRRFQADGQALEAGEEPDWWRLAYNPIGKIVLSAAGNGSMYHRYTGRLCDLQGFQRLLALQIHLRDEGVTPQTPPADIERRIQQAGAGYADPFTGGPMHWAPARQGLAFGAADDRNRKMLPWPL
ncbi:MAG: hypothetical protein EPO01_12580 [Aquabacterium sp.]|nr:MAG: hypothetical protein EPO01_12580 [Aquabacterium sp.]